MNHQFRLLEEFVAANSLISSDAYLIHSLNCDMCRYHRSDAIFRGKNWRGNKVQSLISISFKEKRNLILGHSDQYTGLYRVLFLRALGYSLVSGINVRPVGYFSFPIPIGITNNTDESEYHRLFGNSEHFLFANQADYLQSSNGSIYGCFSTGTNLKERLPLANLLAVGKHCFEEPEFTSEGRIRYLRNLREYAFTVCPVGNGVDTHRLWEVLYMGGIPIIKKNRILESLLKDLPHVVVEDWNQINDIEFLQNAWDRLSGKTDFKFEKLSLEYWINLIHNNSIAN